MNHAPDLFETAAGTFLHDIGKFLQRAHGSVRNTRPAVQALMGDILPGRDGVSSHKHALWTAEFFEWMESQNLNFPRMNRARVREVAIYHHKPLEHAPAGCICAVADRLAAGMERKPKDEDDEEAADRKGWDSFIRTAAKSIFGTVNIGRGPVEAEQPLGELRPDVVPIPRSKVDTAAYQQNYRDLVGRFQSEFASVCALNDTAVFLQALQSLSERFLFAVPSSTKDQPDISLHDHSRAAAAIAAALYRWHEEDGTLADSAAVRRMETLKFRFVTGDLSGIQSSLFLLANQNVRGAAKILRARSFLLGMTVDAAALLCRTFLGYPVFNVLQSAGGRFVLLVANTRDVHRQVDKMRSEIEGWMYRRHVGEAACHIALTEPLSGTAFLLENADTLGRAIRNAVDDSKSRPFSTAGIGIHRELDYSNGPCTACGSRPAQYEQGTLCSACEEEQQVGATLPRLTHVSWRDGPAEEGAARIQFFGNLTLILHDRTPDRVTGAISMERIWRPEGAVTGPFALRWISNYVPRLTDDEIHSPKYAYLSSEAKRSRSGDLKTFEHLAWDAVRLGTNGDLEGQPMLAVLKADVDRLGAIFGFGLADRTLGRVAALSRMMDFFFTGYLNHLLATEFPNIYMVYAGGDDLLLVGPWIDVVRLAPALQKAFTRWTGMNPNITLSAGIELMKMNHPIRRTVAAAEERLEGAKEGGRDRISLLGSVLEWPSYSQALETAQQIGKLLEDRTVGQTFVYRMLEFDRQRQRAEPVANGPAAAHLERAGLRENKLDLEAAGWRSRWGYQLRRNVIDRKDLPEERKQKIVRLLSSLLGLNGVERTSAPPIPARVAISVALYNHRSASERD